MTIAPMRKPKYDADTERMHADEAKLILRGLKDYLDGRTIDGKSALKDIREKYHV